jgi:hypothetical protein
VAKTDNFVPRPPDYKLAVLSKSTEHRGNVGVAWKNADGSIRIQLNPFVVLTASEDLVATLFVNDGPKWAKKKKAGGDDRGSGEIQPTETETPDAAIPPADIPF